jgi:hypothetical protein
MTVRSQDRIGRSVVAGRDSGCRLVRFLVVGAAVGMVLVLAGCDVFPRESPGRSTESSLREIADEAPPGGHVYWLGPKFQDASVSYSSGSWGPHATVSYSGSVLDIAVDTYRVHAPRSRSPVVQIKVRVASGQDVLLRFRRPKRPSAELRRAARAALTIVPRDVSYDG